MSKTQLTRRGLLIGGAAVATTGLLTSGVRPSFAQEITADSGGAPAQQGYTPVVTPNGKTLEWNVVDGVKVFHLVAEEVTHEIAPGLLIDAWGYNGSTPGPTIEAVEGERVRIYVTNHLPEPTTVHWHGLILPNGMDGVAGLTQKPIAPGETFRYEFTLKQHGTYMYHPHYDEMTQMALGMMGMFVIHPKQTAERRPDRDFVLMLSEWKIKPGTRRPDPMAMNDFNVLTLNSRAFPGTDPLVAKKGDLVRIRLGNLGAMDHHPMHIHGHRFLLTETDGGQIAPSAQWPEATVLVPVGTTRVIEFIADAEGDWPFHCHMTHHIMNQMGHDLPNLIGVDVSNLDSSVNKLLPEYMTMGEAGSGGMGEMQMEGPANSISMLGAKGPFSYIDMGGMFTIIKVRDGITTYADPGWYSHPEGTVSVLASAEELRRDRIEIRRSKSPKAGSASGKPTHRHSS